VLSDGTDTYLYSAGRIAQYDTSGAQYFLGDALGSVRQLVDANGELLLAQCYEPYGAVLASAGEGTSSYGFAAEMRDTTRLIYLRARYYSSYQGRFISKDTWPGDYNRPLSLNGWNYVEADPINGLDPSGRCLDADMDGKCDPGWRCSMIADPVAQEACWQSACADPKSGSPIDPSRLHEYGAQAVYDTYIALRYNAGWWNNEGKDVFTPFDMLDLLLSMEFSDRAAEIDSGLQEETTVRNFYYICDRGGWCDSKSEENIIEYITAKDLTTIEDRHMLVPKGTDPKSKWIDGRVRWSNVDFSQAFKNPGVWQTGGKDLRVPIDWGNLTMLEPYYSLDEMNRAKYGTFGDYGGYIAENEFYFRFGDGTINDFVILNNSQVRYWKNGE
jgi:RHS repeat-associated protein